MKKKLYKQVLNILKEKAAKENTKKKIQSKHTKYIQIIRVSEVGRESKGRGGEEG